MYVATINVPGYLPMDDEPATFETAQEAWEYLAEERQRAEDEVPDWTDHDCAFPRDCDYTLTYEELARRARWAASGLVCDFEAVGVVYGPTPGYDGDHDLGLAYCVTYVEEA